MLLTVGASPVTVNGRVPLVPPGVVTETVPAPSVALAEIVKVVVGDPSPVHRESAVMPERRSAAPRPRQDGAVRVTGTLAP